MDKHIVIFEDEKESDEQQAVTERNLVGDKEGAARGTVLDSVVANVEDAVTPSNGAGTAKRERKKSKYLSGPYTDPKVEAKRKRKTKEGGAEAEAETGSSRQRKKVKENGADGSQSQRKVYGNNKCIPDLNSQDPIHDEGLLDVNPLDSLPTVIDWSKRTKNLGKQFMKRNPRIKDLARNVSRESLCRSLPSSHGAATPQGEVPRQDSFGSPTVVREIDKAISAMFVARERAVVLEQSAQIAERAHPAAEDMLKMVEAEHDAALLRSENAEA